MSKKIKWLVGGVVVLALLGWGVSALAVAPADFGLKEGDVIRATGDLDVYIVNDHGFKRLFVNPAIFNLYGHLGFSKVKEVTPAVRDAFKTSGLFRVDGDVKVYGLDVVSEDVANLRWVNTTGAQAVLDDPAFFSKVFVINAAEKALYGTGADYTSVLQVPDYTRGGPVTPPVLGFNPNGNTQGSIDGWDLGYADESNLSEGQNGEIFVAEADLSNEGPLMLTSVDVLLQQTNLTKSMKPWNYFSTMTVLVNGKAVATKTVDSGLFSKSGDVYRLRLAGMNPILTSDEVSTVSVKMSVLGNLDSADTGATWKVTLGDYRVLDESGFMTSSNAGVNDTFTIASPEVAEINIKDATNDIDASVIKVSETSNTNGVAIYAFDIEEKGGVDVVINDLKLDFNTSAPSDQVIARAYLFKGSTKLGDEAVPASGVVLFENLNLAIAGDGKATLTVKVDLRDNDEGARYAEGATLSVNVLTADIALEDDNGNDESDIVVGPAVTSSNTHELRSKGITLELVSVSAVQDSDALPDRGMFTMKFKVTAFGDTIYVGTDCNVDVLFTVGGATPVCVTSTTEDLTLPNNNIELSDGATATITLDVVSKGAGSGVFAKLDLTGVKWGITDVVALPNTYGFNLDDFETATLFLGVL